jgi:nucleoside-diphosphate-sugar epimerase
VNEAVELIASFAGHGLEVRHVESEKGDVRNTGAETSRARQELGFSPTTSVEAGLRAEFEWMLNQERRPIHASK